MPEAGAWKAAYRLVRIGARLVAMLVAVVLLGAALYEHIGAWKDSRVLKQIGRSVDIGGRTLNIHCTGEGSPTVVFVSGRTGLGYVWTLSQRGVSAFTRACWYDRADVGWSDPGPDPAWGDAAARDLHQLVKNAGLRRPHHPPVSSCVPRRGIRHGVRGCRARGRRHDTRHAPS